MKTAVKIETIKVSEIVPNENNPRIIKEDKFAKLVESIKTFPEMLHVRPLVIDENNVVLGGNMRLKACIKAGLKDLPVIRCTNWSEERKAEFIIKDNVGFGEWDWSILANEWDVHPLVDWGLEVWEETFSEPEEPVAINKLSDTFIVPPFSILDTRQGYWQSRKKTWKSMINDNGESRETSMNDLNDLKYGSWKGSLKAAPEVSILDPVLAEVIVRWFGIEKGTTFDCFAGDTVFGFVSDYLGQNFTGIEIRQEQADLNNQRVKNTKSKYICDDGQNVSKHIKKTSQDLLVSCPPYFDLEVYSDLENDASNQKSYDDFIKILDKAFSDSIKCLKDNRFAVIVCGDVRDKKGNYFRFPDHIKDIFQKGGMNLYNEMIMVEMIGTLPMRAAKTMKNRKVSKCHQNILVFYKGDPKNIQTEFPKLDINYEIPDAQFQFVD
tara:strand:+ start:264 stop:1574 length:1311 start_codon:yes stop_codon:yes gene_type:complete